MPLTITITQDGVTDQRDISAELESSLAAFQANQNSLGQSPPYASLAEVVMFSLTENLFRLAVHQFPPKSVIDAQDAVEVAKASVETAKETVLLSASAKLDVSPAPSPVEIIR